MMTKLCPFKNGQMHSWFSQASIYQLTLKKTQNLLKYMHDERLGAERGGNWKKYDEQFRLRMSMNPVGSWRSVDKKLWLMFMASPATQLSLPQAAQTKIMHNKCFTYNYRGICQKPICNFGHLCIKCSKPLPIVNCFYNPQTFRDQITHFASTFLPHSKPPDFAPHVQDLWDLGQTPIKLDAADTYLAVYTRSNKQDAWELQEGLHKGFK